MTLLIDPEEREIRELFRAVAFKNREVLEIGCGDGRLTFRYAAVTRRVHAFDQFDDLVKLARQNTPTDLRGKIHFGNASAEQLPYPAERFDLALLAWSL